jgi:hypothetical protein
MSVRPYFLISGTVESYKRDVSGIWVQIGKLNNQSRRQILVEQQSHA